MYELYTNLVDAPDGNGFCEAYLLTPQPEWVFPFDRDKTAKTYTDRYIQRYDCFTAQEVGTPHPTLKKQISGTIEANNGSTSIVGTSTQFTSDFLIGDLIWINGNKCFIASVTDDTNLVLTEDYVGVNITGTSAFRAEAYLTREESLEVGEDGLLRFNRIYSTIPEGRTEYGTIGFSCPAFKTNSADTTTIRSSFNEVVVTKQIFSYIRTNNPNTDLVINSKFKITDPSSNIVSFVANDTTPNLTAYQGFISGSTNIRSAETRVTPYAGNIWELLDQEIIAK
jgi:hypothetical protein